ncbi:hypothetical protein [Micavibrio aeruginosavorus]|uniref:Uncharacterized protein n=1 Tax=Micavibrio aeruginosavorus EPB TaxID=349215 RepID=M4VG26_9BACT|nr:hypothetical protein [Micavibrio aeruginosavorus]AGH98337.1 hypothetical protein A11S_1531 [Micavibrio aeruginosavorus EPB]
MSREYAESRIREALRLSRGNATKARQQVIAWSYEDPRLLMALAQPHLTGIVAHAVNRVVEHPEGAIIDEDIPATPRTLDMAPDTFGKEILKALSGAGTAIFGHESGSPALSGRRKKASQSHIDALKKLAGRTPPADKK